MYLEMLSQNKYLFSQPQIKYLYGKMKIENKTKDHAVKDWLLLVYFIGYKDIGIICVISIRYFIQSQEYEFIINIYCMDTKKFGIFLPLLLILCSNPED